MKLATKTGKFIEVSPVVDPILEYHNLTLEQLQGKSKKGNLPECRQWMAFFIRNIYPQVSLNSIALLCGKKSHVTILYSIKKVREEMESYLYKRHKYHELQLAIGILIGELK